MVAVLGRTAGGIRGRWFEEAGPFAGDRTRVLQLALMGYVYLRDAGELTPMDVARLPMKIEVWVVGDKVVASGRRMAKPRTIEELEARGAVQIS